MANGVDRVHSIQGRIGTRKVDPIQHRENVIVLFGQVNDPGMPLREDRESAFGANNVDRLPEAVQDQNRLGKYRVHLEIGRLRRPFRLSSVDGRGWQGIHSNGAG